MMTYAQESRKDNVVLGEWARSGVECRHPELKFTKTQLNISVDVDGASTAYGYSNVRYVLNSQGVLVRLNEQHPYSKTSDKETLLFKVVNQDTIALQLLKNKTTQFVRCANQNWKK